MNSITYHVIVDSSIVAFGLEDKLEAFEVAKSWFRCFPKANVKVFQSSFVGGFSIDC